MPGTHELSFPTLTRDSPRPWEHRRWRDPSPPPRPSSRASTRDPEVRRAQSRSPLDHSRPPSPQPTILTLSDDSLPATPDDLDSLDRAPARGRPLASASTPGSRRTSSERLYSLGGFAPGRAFGGAVNDRRSAGRCWDVLEVPGGADVDGQPVLRRACAGCPSCLRPGPYTRGPGASVLGAAKRARSVASVRGAERGPRSLSEKVLSHSPLASLDVENTPTRAPRLGAVRDRIVAVFRERTRSIGVGGA